MNQLLYFTASAALLRGLAISLPGTSRLLFKRVDLTFLDLQP